MDERTATPIFIEVWVKIIEPQRLVTPFKMSLNIKQILAVYCHESPEGYQASIVTVDLGQIFTTDSYAELTSKIEVAKNEWIERLKLTQV
jgi:hypothetical protein